MTYRYFYRISQAHTSFVSLTEARRAARRLIKADKAGRLHRDHKGRYVIIRTDTDTLRQRTFYV